nr:unnamed protein product [Digitaria exilis]
MVGIFIGFMPFFSVDVYKKIVSENERLPFHERVIETEMDTKELETVLVEKEVELIDDPEVAESPPVPAMLDDEADFAESSPALPAIKESDVPESRFIEKLVKNERQVEGLPDNCNRVMVWNFNLEPPELRYPTGWAIYKNLEANMPVI